MHFNFTFCSWHPVVWQWTQRLQRTCFTWTTWIQLSIPLKCPWAKQWILYLQGCNSAVEPDPESDWNFEVALEISENNSSSTKEQKQLNKMWVMTEQAIHRFLTVIIFETKHNNQTCPDLKAIPHLGTVITTVMKSNWIVNSPHFLSGEI